MRRRPEAYHEKLRAHEATAAVAGVEDPEDGDGGIVSIHDLVQVKEEGLADRLHYDDHERRSALVRFLDPGVTPEQVAIGIEGELGEFRDDTWQVDHVAPGQVSLSRNGFALGQPIAVGQDHPAGGRAPGPGADRRARAASPGRRADRDAPRARAVAPPPGRRRQPVRVVRPRRVAHGTRLDRAGRGDRRHRLRQRLGRRRRRGSPGARRGRVVEPDRDRLELRGGLRARVPGQRAADLVAHDPRARRDAAVLGHAARGRGARPGRTRAAAPMTAAGTRGFDTRG